jgi:dsRNA-specific ribonuclease
MNNPHNVLITKKDVEKIFNFFGPIGGSINSERTMLSPRNLEYYQTAFTHESYHQSILQMNTESKEESIYINYLSKSSNEILEFLGDNILKTCIGRYIFERYGDCEREGFLTRLKIKIEKCSMLHQFAVNLGFKKFILLSLQIENQTLLGHIRGRGTPAYYEDAFEAFLGAMMEDFKEEGYIYVERFVRNIIENVIDFAELISKNDNFKDSIQRYFQIQGKSVNYSPKDSVQIERKNDSLKDSSSKIGNKNAIWKTPQYIELNTEGPLYRRVFTRILYLTKEQYFELDIIQQNTIKSYTEKCLELYQTENKDIYLTLFEAVSKGSYILSLGSDLKVVSSEQMCAKQGLQNLLLDLNY